MISTRLEITFEAPFSWLFSMIRSQDNYDSITLLSGIKCEINLYHIVCH